jgi:hypothetical protein
MNHRRLLAIAGLSAGLLAVAADGNGQTGRRSVG